MLTATAAFLQSAIRDGAKLRALVRFTDGTTTWGAVSGSMGSGSDLYRTMVAVQAIAPYDGKLDPLTHNFEIGEMFIDFDADWLRDILVANRLKGMQLDIWLGTADLDFADFISYAREHTIESTIPRADGTTTTVVSRGQLQMINEATLNDGAWVGKHLLECLFSNDGKGVLELAGGHSFKNTSFDPTGSDWDDIKHTLAGRGDVRYGASNITRELADNAKAGDMVADIMRLLNADLTENEDGELEVKRFLTSTAAVDHWYESDIIPGSFEQDELESNIINQISVRCGINKEGKLEATYKSDETVSQSTYAYPGESERIFPEGFNTYWCASTPMYIDATVLPDTTGPTTMRMTGAALHSLSGNASGLTVNSSYPIYLLVLDESGNDMEIVKATGLTRATTQRGYVHVVDENGDETQEGPFVFDVTATSVTRGQLGTTATGHGISRVYDITVLVNAVDHYLGRFAFGMPVIRCKTSREKMLIQLGDIITMDSSQFVAYGKDGLSDTTKLQCTGKNFDPLADDPVIEWEFSVAEETSPTRGAKGFVYRPGLFMDTRNHTEPATQWYVKSGFAATTVSDLSIKIGSGIITNGIDTIPINIDTTHLFTASRDTYVYVEKRSDRFSSLHFEEVTPPAGAPTTPANMVFVRKVVTDGSGLDTETGTGTRTEAIDGANLVNATVDTPQLRANAVDSTILEDNAVVAGKVADGGVSAATQLASSTVNADALQQTTLGRFLNSNARFSMWEP